MVISQTLPFLLLPSISPDFSARVWRVWKLGNCSNQRKGVVPSTASVLLQRYLRVVNIRRKLEVAGLSRKSRTCTSVFDLNWVLGNCLLLLLTRLKGLANCSCEGLGMILQVDSAIQMKLLCWLLFMCNSRSGLMLARGFQWFSSYIFRVLLINVSGKVCRYCSTFNRTRMSMVIP